MSKPFDRVKAGIKYLVIHHTAALDVPLKDAWNPNNSDYPEYEYGIDLDGSFHVGRPLTVQGAHCLPDKDKEGGKYFQEPIWWNDGDQRYDSSYMNQHGISLVFAGSFDQRKATDKQINEAAYNIKRICEKYKIPLKRDSIIPHFKASATYCPGKDTIDRIYKQLGI